MASATISLVFLGPNLDPDPVTAALGVPPTYSRRARDPALRRALGDRGWILGEWSLSRSEVPIDEIAGVVQEFADIFQRAKDTIASVGVEHRGIFIGLFELRGTGEMFHLEPSLLRELASLGLTLSIDAYGNSPEEE